MEPAIDNVSPPALPPRDGSLTPQPSPALSRLLLRGESAVAASGIMVAALLLATTAGLSVFAAQSQRRANEKDRTAEIHAASAVLSQSIETLLARNELSAARALIADAAQNFNLSLCRVTIPGGQTIADADPSQINTRELPASWDRTTADSALPDDATTAADAKTPSGEIHVSSQLNISGRGSAKLELAGVIPQQRWMSSDMQTGIAVTGAVSLIGLLLAYRRMRSRLAAVGAIREALFALHAGEAADDALAVAPSLGAEAVAWNALLTERQTLRRQLRTGHAAASMVSRRGAKGDLDAAFDAMSHGLILVDDNLRIRYANGAAAAYLGVPREAVVASADVAAVINQTEVLEALRSVITGSLRRRTSIEVERPRDPNNPSEMGGVLRFSVRPVRREDSAAAMVLIEDITQQRVAAEARNAFVAQATHELRTPLTNIRLYVETAIEGGENDPVLRGKCLNVINSETRRLERIIGEMLSVAEIEAGSLKLKKDDVRLDALFEEIKADYTAQAQDKQIQLGFDLPPKLPVLHGDRDKITMALHNLVGNALKYTPTGGSVTLRAESDGKNFNIRISDTGIGISEEDAQRIFEKFYRAKDPRVDKITGSGIGLTLAREVIRLHGGDISVESQIDKGSTFTLTLPAMPEAA